VTWPVKLIRISFTLLFVLVPLIFLPWTSELFEFNKMVFTWFLTVVIALAWIVRCITQRQLIFTRTPLDLPLVIFLVSQALSLSFSIDVRTSVIGYYGRWNGGLLSLVSYATLYWAFVSNLDRRSALMALHSSLVTAVLVSIYGILQHFGIDDHLWVQDVKNRVFSTLGQPNWLAAYLVALIFVPISKTLSQKNRPQLILFCSSALLIFIALLFTKSRSGLLAFGLSGAVYGLFVIKHYLETGSRSIIRNFGLILVLTLTLALVIKNPASDLLFRPTSNNQQLSATSGTSLETGGTESGVIRQIVWVGSLRIWRSSPKNLLVGTGPETFALAYYGHRPIEHNTTSEWELLYNKAHNEFLNTLANTGLIGLAGYVLLLAAMAYQLWRSKQSALFAGWASLSVTNFWGFSVVPVQVLLFLLPAMASASVQEGQSTSETKSVKPSTVQIIALIVSGFLALLLIYSLARYWLADLHYSSSQRATRAFTLTEDPQYLVTAYQSASRSYDLNPAEPFILTQLAESAAYLAIFTADTDATSSAGLVSLSQTAAATAIAISPAHPTHYKAASRSFILLSALDPQFLSTADTTLAAAEKLSPTDPRLPYQRAIIAEYQNQPELAEELLTSALRLKPDFADAQFHLDQLASPSAVQN